MNWWWTIPLVGAAGVGVALALQHTAHAAQGAEGVRMSKADPRMQAVRAGVVRRALAEWQLNVQEPPGSNWQRIDRYIRGPDGLAWSSADAAHLGQTIPYTRNRQFQWCGAFAAWAWGPILKASIRIHNLASTARIRHWVDANHQRVEPREVLPGDIVVVGIQGSRDGNHIVICESVDPTGIHTIEGNAHGTGPDGQRHEGVVRNLRPFEPARAGDYVVLYGARFTENDLT